MARRTDPRTKRPSAGRVAALEKKVEELSARLEKAERTAARLRTLVRNGAAPPRSPSAPRDGAAAAAPRSRSAPRDGAAADRRGRAPRGAAGRPAGEGVRCPGCNLVALGSGDRCGWCGFLFAVLPPSRRPGYAGRKKGAASSRRAPNALSLTRRPGRR
ncbi:MAG TPA: hypothetical protein VN033_13705 [Vulgatibacter sp.]|nr:hypothetical protein [Vulgatibacter sp.]